jgi:hypothetical protein
MRYNKDIGATVIPRKDFLSRWRMARDMQLPVSASELGPIDGPVVSKSILFHSEFDLSVFFV